MDHWIFITILSKELSAPYPSNTCRLPGRSFPKMSNPWWLNSKSKRGEKKSLTRAKRRDEKREKTVGARCRFEFPVSAAASSFRLALSVRVWQNFFNRERQRGKKSCEVYCRHKERVELKNGGGAGCFLDFSSAVTAAKRFKGGVWSMDDGADSPERAPCEVTEVILRRRWPAIAFGTFLGGVWMGGAKKGYLSLSPSPRESYMCREITNLYKRNE